MKSQLAVTAFVLSLSAFSVSAREASAQESQTYLVCYQETEPGQYDMTIPVLELTRKSGRSEEAAYIPHLTPKHRYTFKVAYHGYPDLGMGGKINHFFVVGSTTPNNELASMFELNVEASASENKLLKGYLKVGDNFGGVTIAIGKFHGHSVGCKAQ